MFAFFSIISTKKKIISKLGTNTLSVYTLHGFVVRYIQNTTLIHLPNVTNTALVQLLLLTVILTIILSSNIIAVPFNVMLNLDKYIFLCLKKIKEVLSNVFVNQNSCMS